MQRGRRATGCGRKRRAAVLGTGLGRVAGASTLAALAAWVACAACASPAAVRTAPGPAAAKRSPAAGAAPAAGADEARPRPARDEVPADFGDDTPPATDAGPTVPAPTPTGPTAEPADPAKPVKPAKTDDALPPARRAALSAFLDDPAAHALKARQYPRAVSLYRGLVAARGPADAAALELGRAWTLAGQYEEASAVYAAFAAATADDDARVAAERERRRLATATAPFSGAFRIEAATKEAKEAFKRGRLAFAKKRYDDALLCYRMGYALDPDLPGFLRELGETYRRLGAVDDKNRFFLEYLRVRPLGRNADDIRRDLAQQKLLGTLDVTSALPCDEVWLAGEPVGAPLPVRRLALAPGTYKGLCVSYQYQIGYFEYATVEAGKATALEFRWAVVVNKLEKPYGRIVLEDARRPHVMMDLGIETPEVGVVVPRDGRSLRMVLKADDGSRREERYVKLEPGRREVITW